MSLRIGKVFDIPIKIDLSWVLIFALVTFSLANGVLPQLSPGLSSAVRWSVGMLTSLLFFASVLLHELMHSYVAKKNGLPVGGITLFLFGGVSELTEEPRTPEIELKMALAGPLTSIVIGAVLIGLSLVSSGVIGNLGTLVARWLGGINVVLGIFNLIPGFPLDGGRVLRAILWGSLNDLDRATRIASNVGQGFGYLFIFGGFWFMAMGYWINGLWFVFIGWFLNNAAQRSYQQVVLRRALSGVNIGRIMTTEFTHVDPDTTLEDFVHDYLLKYDDTAFPVSRGEELVGIITINEVRDIPRENWANTTVRSIAKPPEEEKIIDENDDAFDALMHMAQGNTRRLLVMHEGRLKGMVTQESIVNIVRTKLQLGM